jgi:hypothetical protein
MMSRTSKRADLAPTQWRQSMFARAALWQSHGDNAFHAMLFIVTPPLVALIMIGMVG